MKVCMHLVDFLAAASLVQCGSSKEWALLSTAAPLMAARCTYRVQER
jgi:hypothetical protein